MEASQSKSRSKRGGRRKYLRLSDLPAGRAPVGVAIPIADTVNSSNFKSLTQFVGVDSDTPSIHNSGISLISEAEEALTCSYIQANTHTVPSPSTLPSRSPKPARTPNEMLGAQARAAELQAMRSQAERQRTRDSEDLPKPVPVSLTDFARIQHQNKNKGPKPFKPLSLADLDDGKQAEHSSHGRTLLSLSVHTDGHGSTTANSNFVDKPGRLVSTPDSVLGYVPTAPRAMLGHVSIPNLTATKTCVANTFSGQQPPLVALDTPGMFDEWFEPLTFNRIINPYSQMSFIGSNQDSPGNNPLTYQPVLNGGFLFGLDEYSPTKPEIEYDQLHTHMSSSPRFFCDRESIRPNLGTVHLDQRNTNNSYRMRQSISQHTLCSESLVCPHHQIQIFPIDHMAGNGNLGYLQEHHIRTNTFVNDLMKHQNKLKQAAKAQISTPSWSDSQPYDRSTKIQNFVAAQQAMAKTGRTVLNNSALHRTTSPSREQIKVPASNSELRLKFSMDSLAPIQSPRRFPADTLGTQRLESINNPYQQNSVCEVGDSSQIASEHIVKPAPGLPVQRRIQDCPAVLRALKKRDEPRSSLPPPGLDQPDPSEASQWPTINQPYTNTGRSIVDGESFGGGCELRPLTLKQREETKFLFRNIANEMSIRHEIDMIGHHTAVVGGDAMSKWLLDSTPGNFELYVKVNTTDIQ